MKQATKFDIFVGVLLCVQLTAVLVIFFSYRADTIGEATAEPSVPCELVDESVLDAEIDEVIGYIEDDIKWEVLNK